MKHLHALKKIQLLLLCLVFPVSGMAAVDESNLSPEEISAFCEGLWKVARGAVQERGRGTSEDEMLERLSEGLRRSTTLGPNMKHMMRTTVKGAYLTELTPSKYAGTVQAECMKAAR